MNKQAFSDWLRELESLSPSQWQQLHSHLERTQSTATDRLLEAHPPAHCPHCQFKADRRCRSPPDCGWRERFR